MVEILNKVFLGTSGWSYKDWVGPFYTKKDKSMLRAYAKVFRTVEIDSTFYRYPSKAPLWDGSNIRQMASYTQQSCPS